MAFCQKCGSQIGDQQKFCPKCGEKQFIDSTPVSAPAQVAKVIQLQKNLLNLIEKDL